MAKTGKQAVRRKARVRRAIKAASGGERPRLSVFRSSKHIYAQVIDDAAGRTLAATAAFVAAFFACHILCPQNSRPLARAASASALMRP